MEFLYESPVIDVVEIALEGVLCASGSDMDMNPEEGNM
jgi:hypothetical protein